LSGFAPGEPLSRKPKMANHIATALPKGPGRSRGAINCSLGHSELYA
jgi:hypothetical protein